MTRSPDFIAKLSKWKKADFQKIMLHEFNHIFWYDIIKNWSPNWLVEGLAAYQGNNFNVKKEYISKLIKKNNVDSKILSFRYVKRNFISGHIPRYPVWQAFVTYIIKKYSVAKLRHFVLLYSREPTKMNYQFLFKKTFGKTDFELFDDFRKECGV